MTRDELEFRISQYLDGDLSPAERSELELRLSSDASARVIFQEYKAINDALSGAAAPPAIQWDRLADTIAAAAAEQHLARSSDQAPVRLAADETAEHAVLRSMSGELSPDEQGEHDRRLEQDAAVRDVAAQHRALEVALQHGMPLPHVDFNRLSLRISEAVAEQQASVRDAAEMEAPVDETIEQSIVSLVDGDVAAGQAQEVSASLAAGAAQRLLKQHRSLQTLLQHGMPLPHVDWGLLQSRISTAVAEADAASNRTISLSRWRTVSARIAIAAVIALGSAMVVWVLKYQGQSGSPQIVRNDTQLVRVIEIVAVDAPPADSAGPRVIDISVGPSPEIAREGFNVYAAGAVVSMPSRVQIAERPVAMLDDGLRMPF